MTSLGAASVPIYVGRALSRRTFSMAGDPEANRKEVFEVPHPRWPDVYMKTSEEIANIKKKASNQLDRLENSTKSKTKHSQSFKKWTSYYAGNLVHHVLYSFENPSEYTRLLSADSSISKREQNKERLVQDVFYLAERA
ncbi:hypothetical protein RSOLAG22IIIB_10027 [Rhizoctonia solani]|uniref:Uncharacterized protein n=1 Tax=Rhizoctonia solani TaxID=456999 RepID=A0A0K6G0J8_9AGAM|nr:hypothetical protein RSOLAG22IIIB_10027 [Rhizoctonia solani]